VRLTDLLDADVVDRHGRSLGHVHDVRLVQDGPPVGGSPASFRIDGLITGGTALGARLGFARSEVRGPVLLKRLFHRLQGDERFVPWSSVRAVLEGRLVVEVDVSALRRPDPLH
jgi:hypothetical protein